MSRLLGIQILLATDQRVLSHSGLRRLREPTETKTKKELEKKKKRAQPPVLRNGHLGAEKRSKARPGPSIPSSV